MGLRLRTEDVWRGIVYGPFVGVGLRISAKSHGNGGEIDLSKGVFRIVGQDFKQAACNQNTHLECMEVTKQRLRMEAGR